MKKKTFARITFAKININSESGFDSRRTTPSALGSSSRTPGSGGSLKIGRRSGERSKSPFRSFRWKRGSSRNIELDYDEEGNKLHSQNTNNTNNNNISTNNSNRKNSLRLRTCTTAYL